MDPLDLSVGIKEDEEEAPVEPPQRTTFIRPGHLWTNDQNERMQMVMRSADDAWNDQTEMLSEILRRNHCEVLKRLSWQDDLLQEMRRWCNSDPAPRWDPDPRAFKPAGAPVVAATNEDSRDSKSPGEKASMSALFRTFESTDEALREGAATVDADEAARKRRMRSQGSYIAVNKSLLQRLVGHTWFDIFFAWVVVTNSIFIGFEVQIGLDNGGTSPSSVQSIQYVYTVIFTIELLLRIGAAGRSFFWSEDCLWNWLDIFIVLSSLWEAFTDILLAQAGGVHLTGLKALRLVRISRIVKVARLARVLRFVMALRTLISSIIYTLKSLVWAIILLGLIVYVFAVMFTQAVGDYLLAPELDMPAESYEASRKHFGSLQDTMLSLFMSIAGGVSWEEVIRPLKAISTIWVIVFLFYIAFTYFAVLNVVTGVFCQSAIDSAQNDQTLVLQSIQAEKQANTEKIISLFKAIDVEETGVITYKMLEEQVNTAAVQTYFEAIGLDVWDAWSFFKLLDDDAGGAVEMKEFLLGCLRLRGQARSMDVVKIMRDQAWLLSQQGRFWTYVEAELVDLRMRLGGPLQRPMDPQEAATSDREPSSKAEDANEKVPRVLFHEQTTQSLEEAD